MSWIFPPIPDAGPILLDVGATATLDKTDPGETLTSEVDVLVTPSLSKTDPGETTTTDVDVLVTASLDKTDPAETLTGEADVLVTASLSKTDPSETLDADATVLSGIDATLSKTDPGETSSSEVDVLVTASLDKTDPGETSSSEVDVFVVASLSQTDPSETLDADATSGGTVTASLSKTDPGETSSSEVDVLVTASLSKTDPSETVSAVAYRGPRTLTLSKTDPDFTLNADTLVVITGTVSETDPGTTLVAAAVHVPGFGPTGTLSKTDPIETLDCLVEVLDEEFETPTPVGPQRFHFAWVDPTETGFQLIHVREDEDVFAFSLGHSEGDFATLALDILNPRIGLLNAGRKRWAWLSYTKANGVTVPLFFGRLIGVPQQMQDEIVRLDFVARPNDFGERKATLAEELKVEPYWDPMWISEQALSDPDSVLEARPQLWHCDRITHDVSVSNITSGEDGTLAIGGSFFYDSLGISYGAPPVRKVRVEAEARWQQAAAAVIDIRKKFPRVIETYTGEGLFRSWPKGGESIGFGWEVWRAQCEVDNDLAWADQTTSIITLNGLMAVFTVTKLTTRIFEVAYNVNRGYSERLTFDLEADVQPLLVEPGDEDVIIINLTGDADQAVDDGGAMPIGTSRSRRYFQTERGIRSARWLALVARARLLNRARAVDVTFEIPFEDGLGLSCRLSSSIEDDRLPGGTATGKIKGYTLSADGASGALRCSILMGCTIGKGGTVTPAAGTLTYVSDGYVNDGYVYANGAQIELVPGEIVVDDFSSLQPNDDNMDLDQLTADNVVESVTVINDQQDQEQAAFDLGWGGGMDVDMWGMPDPESIAEFWNTVFTEVELKMVEFESGPFETPMPITLSALKIPKTIDLEAASS